MKLGMIITHTEPETVFNALRLALYSREQGDEVKVFLMGKGVEIDKIQDHQFDVVALAENFLQAGGKFLACGSCLKLRQKGSTEICPLSTLKDVYELVKDSDRVVTF
jgi:uncharacterized protein involved in oxidation of intracellular sulfur